MKDKIIYYLTPIFRIILFVFFIFLCLIPFGLLSEFNLVRLDENSLLGKTILEIFSILAIIGALFMMFKVLPILDFEKVFIVKEGAIKGFVMGGLIGIGLIGICALILLLSGNVIFTVGKISYLQFFGYLLLFILVAIFEELTFRTLVLFAFAERYWVFIAIFFNSVLFALVHLANPNFNWLAMVNIVLAGAIFCIYTLQKRNVSWAIGIHFTWNCVQGTFLGYKVSGLEMPGIFLAKPIGNEYLSGGAFGIEGSLVCTIVLSILMVYLLVRYQIAPIENATGQEEFEEQTETV